MDPFQAVTDIIYLTSQVVLIALGLTGACIVISLWILKLIRMRKQ